MAEDYRKLIKEAVLDESTFVKLTMKGIVRGPAVPWHKIVIRPVQVRNKRQLQISYFDAKQDISKNYYGQEALDQVDAALAIPFSSIVVQSTEGELQIQLTKKGKPIVHRHRRPPLADTPPLEHNRSKALPLPADRPDLFLQTIGIMNGQGQVRPQMQGKFSQINEFLKLIEASGELERFEKSPIEVLDCGCGSSYLTFALYHYLNDIRAIPARLVGVDVNAELIRKSALRAEELHFADIGFHCAPIADFQPEVAPDLVIALHACDTATDEAIAQAIRYRSRMLVCAPCCHHDLNEQIASELFRPVLRHGILKQRMADILTDAFRALALRIMGYKADVIEFVAAEHTAKNLMIRAVRATEPGDRGFVREYNDLKRFWQVTPYIEKLLGEEFRRLLQHFTQDDNDVH